MGILDAPGVPLRTIRSIYGNGGQGTSTNYTTGTQGCDRIVLRLPVTTSRFRIKVRNFNTVTNTGGVAGPTGKGILLGQHAPGSLGIQTGQFKNGAATTIQSTDFAIPVDGSWYSTPWITAQSAQIKEFTEYVLAVGYDNGATTLNLARGAGQSWHTTTYAAGLNPADNTAAMASATPLDIQLEYEAVTQKRVVWFLGDSITEGYGGDPSQGNPLYYSWPRLWADRNRAIALNTGLSGSTTFDWQTFTNDRWSRIDWSSMTIDGLFIGLGANDVNNGTSLGTFQSYFALIAAKMRALAPNKPLYGATISPRALTGTNETNRGLINTWLRGLPGGTSGVFDMDTALRDPAALASLLAENSYDGTHPTRIGYNRMVAAAAGSLAA